MTVISNNEIARAIYLISKDKTEKEQGDVFAKGIKFLNKKRLLSKAPDILSRLNKIINTVESRVVAKVSSKEKISSKTKTDLEHFLKRKYSAHSVRIEEKTDESLIGGIKIEVGDEVLDMTVKNKISKLQAHLTQ